MIVSKLREVIVPLTRQATRHYHIPSKTVASYTQRDDLWSELEEKLKVHHKGADIPFAVALHGLGGAGKSQLALKYAETSLDHYSSVIWIDATDEASIRASFFEFAQEMGLVASQSVTRDNEATQKVLKWLRDQTGFNGKWLVILDNADDLSLDIQRVIPKGPQGTLIITSQDERSPMLVKGGCEYLHVAAMTPIEGRSLLLQHLPWDLEKTPSEVQNVCDQLSQMLGYLALAVDLAGAYIGNDPSPEQALTQYLKDFKKHRDQMLQTDDLRSLTASGKTVWTVWTTTLERIGKDYGGLKSGMLLTFLAHFDGKVIPNELFRLASQGMSYMDSELGKAGFSELRDFIAVEDTSWDSFHYRRALDVLARYSLVQRLGGDWTGVTMHDLVRWRARKNTQDHPWKCWHAIFVLAACQQFIVERYWFYFPDLLTTHIQNIKEGYCEGILDQDAQNILLWRTAGKIHYHRWEWNEAQRYYEQLSDALRIKFGEDHNHTLSSMSDLASVYINQGKKDQAMELYVRILQLQRIKIGNQHPITLRTMSIVAHQYWKQGRVDMAQSLYNEVMEARMINFGAYSSCKFNLAELLRACWQDWQNWKQGLRGNKIEKFYVRVMVAPKLQLVNVYPGERTESIILHIASDYFYQGQLFEAEKLFVQALEAMKVKLGDDNISLFYESINLARIYTRMGRYDEAEDLYHHIIKKNTRDDQLLKRLAAQGLAWLYQAQGRDDEGQRLWDQMVRGRSDHHRNPSARRSWIPAD
jgi:tetratricopeptide (TPR) repeat protein